jgi:1-phosphofructokinase
VLRLLIESEEVAVRAVECRGANGGYLHDRRGGERHVVAEVASPVLDRHETDDLYNAALTTGLGADAVVLTGPARPEVIAADVYRRLAIDLASNGVHVVTDLSGEALHALEAGVTVLKVSHTEVIDAGLAEDDDPRSLAAAAAVLHGRGARTVVVSRAEAPALALAEGRLVALRAPKLEAADPRGAGDSMTAGMAVGLARRLPLEECLRLGAAAGALNVTRHGLATGERANVEALLPRIEIVELGACAR